MEYGSFLNVNLLVVEDVAGSSADLKREFKSSKLPQFRFYPNNKTGSDKRNDSYELMLPKSSEVGEVKEAILEEIMSNYETDVKDVSEKVYYSLAAQNARDGIISVAYLYDGSGVDFTFKAVSADPWMKDHFVFYAIDGPSESMTQGASLPTVSGMLEIDEENPSPRLFNFQGMTKVHYAEVLKNLLQMKPSRYEAFEEEWRMKNFKKQNPGQDVEASMTPTPREFTEVTGAKSWNNLCK